MATDNNNKVLNVPNLRFPEFTEEWIQCAICDYGNIITGSTPSTNDSSNYDNGTYLWASPTDLGELKYVEQTQTKLTDKGFGKTRRFPANSIMVTCIGSTIGKMGMSKVEMSTNQQINTIVPTGHDANFVFYTIQSRFPRYLSSIAVQAVPIISKSSFEKLENYTTSIDEEVKIGTFLSLLDERIATQNKIIEDLKKLKVAIIEKVFSENKCNCKIGDVISQISHRNRSKKETNILSVSNKWGFVEQSEQFEDRIVASEDITNYKIVRINDFAYNPARINVGSIARLKRYESGIVSPMYICFHSQNALLPEYLELFFYTQYFKHEMYKRLEGSVRLCLSFEGLTNIPIFIPEITTQRENSIKVNSIETKIGIEETYLNALKVQKQYLLKHMFI